MNRLNRKPIVSYLSGTDYVTAIVYDKVVRLPAEFLLNKFGGPSGTLAPSDFDPEPEVASWYFGTGPGNYINLDINTSADIVFLVWNTVSWSVIEYNIDYSTIESNVVLTLTPLINEKVDKTAVKQITGNSTTDLMSQAAVTAHIDNENNPHSTTKDHVGLGNADNTSDVNKPVSTAQAAADAAVSAKAEADAIQLLRLHDPNLVFSGFVNTGTATPPHSDNKAYVATESGTIFGLIGVVKGQFIVVKGQVIDRSASFVKEDIGIAKLSKDLDADGNKITNLATPSFAIAGGAVNVDTLLDETFPCFERFKGGDLSTLKGGVPLRNVYAAIKDLQIIYNGVDVELYYFKLGFVRNNATEAAFKIYSRLKSGGSWSEFNYAHLASVPTPDSVSSYIIEVSAEKRIKIAIDWTKLPYDYSYNLETDVVADDPICIIKQSCVEANVEAAVSAKAEAEAIQLLRLHDPNLVFSGFVNTSTPTPAHTANKAYFATESGTIFGITGVVKGQIVVDDGSGFVSEKIFSRTINQLDIIDNNSSNHAITVDGNNITFSWDGGIRLVDRSTGNRMHIGSSSGTKSITVTKGSLSSCTAKIDTSMPLQDQDVDPEIIGVYTTIKITDVILINSLTQNPTGLLVDFFASVGVAIDWNINEIAPRVTTVENVSKKLYIGLSDINSSNHAITVDGNNITFSWDGGIRLVDRSTRNRMYIGSSSGTHSITVTKGSTSACSAKIDTSMPLEDQDVDPEIIGVYTVINPTDVILINAFTNNPTGLLVDFFTSLGITPTWNINDLTVELSPKREIKQAIIPTITYPNVISKISSYHTDWALRNKDINIVILGDSIMARTVHTSLYTTEEQQSRPPMLISKNIASAIWDKVNWQNVIYSRWDKSGVFTETGSGWTSYFGEALYAGWDDAGDRAAETRRFSGTGTASVEWAFPATFKRLNFIYRTATDGANLTVAIAGGNGKIEVYNGSSWVEANGYTFSQGYTASGTGYGNTEFQRRLKFRKASGEEANAHTITISKGSSASAEALMYWGIEYSKNDYWVNVRNVARGGHHISNLRQYMLTEFENFDVDLVLFEIPLLNMKAGLSYTPDEMWNHATAGVNELIFGVEATSLKTLSNDFTTFKVVAFTTHEQVDWINSDGTWKQQTVSGEIYTSLDYFQQFIGRFINTDVPYVDVFSKFNQECINQFGDMYTATLASSATSENSFMKDGTHQNDFGTEILLRYILPIFDFN
jgi:hypothetical protein